MQINTYDIDGVINMGAYVGLKPREHDIIITGRSKEDELMSTVTFLTSNGIFNTLYMQDCPFDEKTRESSGIHKGETLNFLKANGYNIGIHFEDDPIQMEQINRIAPWVQVVLLQHDLTEKENVHHEP